MTVTIAEIFDLAIQAEVKAQEIYTVFARRFAHEPEVARFWEHYATEEREHGYWLGKIQKSVPDEKLAEAADPQIYRDAQHALAVLNAAAPEAVANLEEAYQIANEAESSEVTTVFRFLVENFSSEPQTRHLLTQHLRHHIDDITFHFPKKYQSGTGRMNIAAR
jgi:rubrerythrin